MIVPEKEFWLGIEMGNFVLRKDPIHFLLGCLILISLSESEFRIISD